MGNAPFCDASKDDPNVSTLTEDWTKEDLNRHLRELLVQKGELSPPPRSVSIERTPIVVWSPSQDDDDTASSPMNTPRTSMPPHGPLIMSYDKASTADHKDHFVAEDENSTQFLFEEVVTSTDLSLPNGISWYCSRLIRILCLCFTLYLAYDQLYPTTPCPDRYEQITDCSRRQQRQTEMIDNQKVLDWFYDGGGQAIPVMDQNCHCSKEFSTSYQFLYFHTSLNIPLPSQPYLCNWEAIMCHENTYSMNFGACGADGTIPFDVLDKLALVESINVSFNPKLQGTFMPHHELNPILKELDVRGTNVSGKLKLSMCESNLILLPSDNVDCLCCEE